MMGPQAPCRWCKERTAECHATCKRYKEYEAAREEFREENWKEREQTAEINSFHAERLAAAKNRQHKWRKRGHR